MISLNGGMGVKRYLIIGNGVAGARAAVKIREADSKGEIHIFTEETYPFYYRVRFPEFVSGEVTLQSLTIHSKEYYQEKGISIHLQELIKEVYREKKKPSVREERPVLMMCC